MLTLKIDCEAMLYPLETSGHQRLVEQIARRLLREQKLPAKKDQAGRWVMVDVDYYLSLRGATHGTREKGPDKDQ